MTSGPGIADVGHRSGADARDRAEQRCCSSCTEALVEHLDGGLARIWTLNDAERMLELQASAGTHTQWTARRRRGADRRAVGGHDRPRADTAVVARSEQIDPHAGRRALARREGMVAFAGYPLLVDSKLVGVMTIFSRREFSSSAQDTMAAVADGVAVGIERNAPRRS